MAESDVAMAVDSSVAQCGPQLYSALALEVLSGLDLVVPQTKLLRPEKQLEIYHYASQLYDFRDAILAFWKEDLSESSELPDAYRAAAQAVKVQWQGQGTWPSLAELKGKKVFGHASVIKFLALPDLPDSTACVFLQQRPRVASVSSQETPWTFAEGQFVDPIADLEANRSAVIMHMDNFLKGAVVIANPLLRNGQGFATASEQLAHSIAREAGVWRRLLKTEQDLFSQATALLIRQVLKLGPAAVTATVTPKKPRKGADDRTDPDVTMETPEKDLQPGKDAAVRPEQEEQRAYGRLLESMLQELDYFTEPFQSLRWLDNKKQLLVYYHAAQLNERQDSVLAALRQARGAPSQQVEDLLPPYGQAVARVTDEVNKLIPEGQNLRKIFGHDHVIRYHTLKGVPVPRTSCIFLRERPQCSSDVLRKTPSIFRDLIRYRNQGSPLMELEHHQLALVLTVHDRNPRAFVVISPLFEKHWLIEGVSGKTWSEIQEALKDELADLIRRESDAWRAFIQSHADMVSKDSLKIIQRVLKTCQPGSGFGEYALRVMQDVDEANQARELAEMKYAEAEQPWDMEAQLALADADTRWRDARKKADQHAATVKKAKLRARSKAAKIKEKAAKRLEQERLAAEERLETQKAAHCEEVADLTKELEEAHGVRNRMESLASERKEEVQCLQDAKLELLDALSKMDSLCRAETQMLRTKNVVLKQHLKQTKKGQKETLRAAEAKFLEVQTATIEEQQKLIREADAQVCTARREAAAAAAAKAAAEEKAAEAMARAASATAKADEAMATARQATATLEVQTATMQRTTQMNAALRVEAKEAKAEVAAALQEAQAKAEQQKKVAKELEARSEELRSSLESTDKLKAKIQEMQTREVEFEQALVKAQVGADALRSDLRIARAETHAARDEAAALATKCTKISIEAAKVPQLQEDRKQLEQQLAEISQIASRADALRLAEKQLQNKLLQVQAELQNKNELLAQVQESNMALRIRMAEADEKLTEVQEQLVEKLRPAAAAEDALRKSDAQREEAEARAKGAEAAAREAQAVVAEMTIRAERAEKAQHALEKTEIQTKAALAAQAQQAAHLTEKCASLNSALSSAADRAELATSAATKAQQDVTMKEAEIAVLQKSLHAVQASNKSLRAEAMQADHDAKAALSACDVLRQSSSRAQEEAERAVDAAKAAEAKAEVHAADLEKFQQKYQEVVDELAKMQKATEAAEEMIAMAKAEERKAKSQLAAQASEAKRLSSLCAGLHADAKATAAKVSSMEQRALTAEAEKKVALASSELREDDVKRIAAGPSDPSFPDEDRLVAELEALLEQSSDDHREATDVAEAAAQTKRRRFESASGFAAAEVLLNPVLEPAMDGPRVGYAVPVRRVRTKSVGQSVGNGSKTGSD